MTFPLIEVAQVPERTPLDMWGGATGELESLWLSTGARQGGQSKVFRLDKGAPDTAWVDDACIRPSETKNKLRDDGTRLYVFFESDGPFIASRPLAVGGAWSFEPLPGPHFVGGRGLVVRADGTMFVGGSGDWAGDKNGQMYEGTHGSWSLVREHTPGLLWEVEYDSEGRLWEFWVEFDMETGAKTYVDGELVESPGGNTADAAGFGDTMWVNGDMKEPNPTVRRWNGSGWDDVFTMAASASGDHVLRVPRETPELWATGMHPFEVYRSLDGGSTWEGSNVEPFETDLDTNQLTAIAYWQDRVWVAARDSTLNVIRIFSDKGAGLDLILGII